MTGRQIGERFPFDPLDAYLGHPPARVVAEQTGVSRRAVTRWRHNGLSVCQADRAAVAAGAHPALIWPTW